MAAPGPSLGGKLDRMVIDQLPTSQQNASSLRRRAQKWVHFFVASL